MELMAKKIREFLQGDRIEGCYLVKSVICKVANGSNKKYLDFILADKTGEIAAKLWEVKDGIETAFKTNMIVKVKGTVTSWQGSLQLKIEKVTEYNSEDINIDDYVKSAPEDGEKMLEKVYEYINSIKDEDIREVVKEIVEINKEKLLYYPAAKRNHHSLRGGLLYHITTMLKLGDDVTKIYDFLDKDLIYAGVILHDIAKIKEMNASELGIVDEYSLEGTLLGHITQGIKEIEIIGRDLGADEQKIMLLQHMILSHHYEPEYGSPVKPMIAEAEMLHYLDVLDARMYDMRKAVTETKVGDFSERMFSLENRRIFNHGLNKEN
ncbi:MAG: 3'-5' exoribonuclease YhaM family protein [Sarcina sp.]